MFWVHWFFVAPEVPMGSFQSFKSNDGSQWAYGKEWHPPHFCWGIPGILGFWHATLVPNWSPYWFSTINIINLKAVKAPLLRPSDWFRAKYSEWNKMIAMWLLGCNMICWRSCWGGEVDGDSVIIIPKCMLWYVHICSYDVLTFLEQTLF